MTRKSTPSSPGTTITSLEDLTPDPRNANKGTPRGLDMLETSLQQTGAGRSILVDKHGRVIAGNKTLEKWASMMEQAQIRVVQTDGQELVVVQRQDLDLEDPNGLARKLAYYDNRTSELDLAWNADEIAHDLAADMDLSMLWSPEELDKLLARVPAERQPPAAPPSVTCPACGHTWASSRRREDT